MFPNTDTDIIKSNQYLWSILYATHSESFEMPFYWIMHKGWYIQRHTFIPRVNKFYEKFSMDGSCYQFIFDHI